MLTSTTKIGLSCVLLTSVVGCASIVTGTVEEVSFQSTPAGAQVTVDGKVLGVTPMTTTMKKKSGQSITLSKEGYKPYTTRLGTRTSPWFFGNIVIGGFIGSSTDAATGAIYEYTPNQYFVALEQVHLGTMEAPVLKPEEQKAREFIIVAYNNVLTDLSYGGGPHLTSLLRLLSVPDEEAEEAKSQIRALSEIYTDVTVFTERVIEVFMKAEE